MSEEENNNSKADRDQIQERTAIGAHIVLEAVLQEGEDELKRPSSALAWSGLAAGLSMGFSLIAEAILHAHLPDVSWRPLVSKLGYSVGFLIVILGRQQLFTENTLTVILPLLRRKNLSTVMQVIRLWTVVLGANLAGSLLFAWCITAVDAFEPQVRQSFAAISKDAMQANFQVTMVRGIFAGWLIALTVWLLPAAQSARVSIIVIITYWVGLGSFSHIVAGSVKVFHLVDIGAASYTDYLLKFFIPTLIGNIIGGVSLVAALNYAQVVAGDKE